MKKPFFPLAIAGLLMLLPGNASAQTNHVSGPGIEVHDGFETPALSKVWSTDRFEPGAVTMQTNLVRTGRHAARITVRPRAKFEAGINGNRDNERAELREAARLVSRENAAYEFSWSVFFPTNFPIEPTRLVIAQWKQRCAGGGNCDDDSPVLALRYIAGELLITQDINKKHIMLFQQKDEFRGRWLDFKFQVRFSTNQAGRVQASLDGSQILDYHGVTADSEGAATGYPSPSVFYFKLGLYRDVRPDPWTLYVDEYRKKELPQNDHLIAP